MWRFENTLEITKDYTQDICFHVNGIHLVFSSHSTNPFLITICKTQPRFLLSSVHQAMWRWDKDEAGSVSASKRRAFQ